LGGWINVGMLGGVVEVVPILFKYVRILSREVKEAWVYSRLREFGLKLSPISHNFPEGVFIREIRDSSSE
jgi:hypothetical protein